MWFSYVKIATDPQRWHAAQAAGIARVERYYTQDMMFGAYRELYQRSLAQGGQDTDAASGQPLRCPVRH